MSTETNTNPAREFVTALQRITDTGKKAALKRGVSENQKMRRDAWPHLSSLGQRIDSEAAATVAAFYMEHPMHDPRIKSVGEACLKIALAHANKPELRDRFDKRFKRLIACETLSEVTGQLKAWIRFAKDKVPMNYEKLFWDYVKWKDDADDIILRWAKDYWNPYAERNTSPTPQEAAA